MINARPSEKKKGREKMQDLNLTVTLDEANLILAAVAELPFAKVYTLVAKLQDQATRQLDPAATLEAPSVDEGTSKLALEPSSKSGGETPHAT